MDNLPEQQEGVEKADYSLIPKIHARLSGSLPEKMKLMLGATGEKLQQVEDFLRQRHEELHPGSTFVVVDVKKIVEEKGLDPRDFGRDSIYEEACSFLGVEVGSNPLQSFQREAARLYRKNGGRAGLFIENLDVVTQDMTNEELRQFLLGTFRVSGEHNSYGHVTARSGIDLGGSAGAVLNDFEAFVWED